MLFRLFLLPLVLLFSLSGIASAEQYRDFGDYRIHYSAFKSDLIEPSVAKAHDLKRSSYHAIVNITVQKKNPSDGSYEAVNAKVEGSARDIYSKVQSLKMMQVTEGKAIYYLAELPIVDKQKLTFDIRVTPEGENSVDSFSFERQFFVN